MIEYDARHWLDHLFDIKGSMVRQIFNRLLLCLVWSIGVVGVHQFVLEVDFPVTAHSLMGVALSLLLVFRTNSSYNRYWEARTLWGRIINESRNLARTSSAVLADAPDLVKALLTWTMTFSHATMNILRGGKGLGPAANHLPQDEVQAVLRSDHLPLAVSRRMTEQLAEAYRRGVITDYQQMKIDEIIRQLIDCLGGCERIHKTPLPFPYMVHLRRALILYCFTLPFVLIDIFHWWTVLVTLLIAYMLFGIEEIGVEIDDPFGSDENGLPLDRFCMTITMNLYWIVQSMPNQSVEAPAQPAQAVPTAKYNRGTIYP